MGEKAKAFSQGLMSKKAGIQVLVEWPGEKPFDVMIFL